MFNPFKKQEASKKQLDEMSVSLQPITTPSFIPMFDISKTKEYKHLKKRMWRFARHV